MKWKVGTCLLACVLAGVLAVQLAVAAAGRVSGPLDSSMQVLLVTTADWNAVNGTLQRYERPNGNKGWQKMGDPIPVVVGKTGLGWGIGIVATDGAGIRAATDPVKKEGDGRAPAGIFHLSTAFGYAEQGMPGWKMPYVALTPSVECVDDTNSKFYNRLLDRTTVTPDWNSSEQMRRTDGLYEWGIFVDHNVNPPKPGSGSCIFMHIWRGDGTGTVGCTAMQKENIESVLGWLDPAKLPVLVQLPKGDYQRLKKSWGLP